MKEEKNHEILDEIKIKEKKTFSIWLQCHTEGCHGA